VVLRSRKDEIDREHETTYSQSLRGHVFISLLAGVSVFAQPAITIAFSPASVEIGQTSALTSTINNPSASAIANVAFTDVFLANLFVQNPNDLRGGCGSGAAITATSR